MTRRGAGFAEWAALLAVLVVFGLTAPSWMRQWGATPEEQVRAMPGEELLLPSAQDGQTARETRAMTVNAAPDVTWEWMRRIGQGRGGFYSYDWLENLAGADIHNRRELFPTRPMAVGDTIRLTQESYPGARRVALLPVAHLSERSFVLQGWGVFAVESLAPRRSRIIVRERPPVPANAVEAVLRNLVYEPAHFVMERQMLRGIRDRAEGAPPATVEHLLATVGLCAGAAAIIAFLIERRRWWWLLAPATLSALVFLATGGLEATLAGFVALGIPGLIWALVPRGRGRFLVLTSLLGLALLLILAAADAYVAIGYLVGLGATAAIWGLGQPVAVTKEAH